MAHATQGKGAVPPQRGMGRALGSLVSTGNLGKGIQNRRSPGLAVQFQGQASEAEMRSAVQLEGQAMEMEAGEVGRLEGQASEAKTA